VNLPLEGLLVVGLEQAVSAPYATRTLADLGARVIKVESPYGDFTRYYDEAAEGTSAHFSWANRGKQSVVLDLKSPEGRAALERLLAKADVFVQNLAPGAAERMGLDARSLVGRFERLVAVDISGYGHGGPRQDGRAYDLLIQAEAGSCAVTGFEGRPAKPGIPVADVATGMTVANAILAGIIGRGKSGKGTAISIAMFDVITEWMSWALHQTRSTGLDPVPLGVGSPMVSPYGAYETSDGQTIVIGTTNDKEWQRLAREVIERPDLADEPKYADTPGRVQFRSDLDEAIGQWAAQHTFAEASAAAEKAQLGWARLNYPSDVLRHPQLGERGRWVPTRSVTGDVESLRPAADSPDWQWSPGVIPRLGEHTDEVLAEFS
jgi:crotonobetainyl-CoA:carnitine CoA-transferase CaiB-like acyl-CoA transferase